MKNAINLLYITVLMIILMGVVFYISDVQKYDEKYKIYEGAFVNGFEYIMFVSCTEIEEIGKSKEDRFGTDISYRRVEGFDKKYSKYFISEYEPVYLKVRADISKNDGHTWMGFSHNLDIQEVLDIQPYEKRKCDPPYKPGFEEIKVEYDAETPADVFKKLKKGLP